MRKLCFVATIPAAVHSFLKEYIRASAKEWRVKIITDPAGAELLSGLDAQLIPLAIGRRITPWRDLLALTQLVILFRREHFDLVHSITPKAGLLAMLAAWMTSVPVRMHTFTGQVWSNKHGWRRSTLKMFDKLIVSFATHVFVDSPSQHDFLVSEGILAQGQGMVIGHGSICGVDHACFRPDAKMKIIVREQLGISQNATVLLFLGRLNRNKGMLDLAAAFANISRHRPDTVLLLVGTEEDVSFTRIQKICEASSSQLRRVSFTSNPEHYMVAADIFCLPSYREGFGQVLIEAAASGIPSVASRIYGITDAVEDGKTGLLFPAGDVAALTKTLLRLIEDQALCQQMGEAARVRSIELFASTKITEKLIDLYRMVLP